MMNRKSLTARAMTRAPVTFKKFLVEEQRRFPEATGELTTLLLDVASACKAIARNAIQRRFEGEMSQQPERYAVECFLLATENSGALSGLLSGQGPHSVPMGQPRGHYLLLIDALNGAPNLEVNGPAGSIFSILRSEVGRDVTQEDFLQQGQAQVAAGYVLYGPVTMLVLSLGNGVHGFSLDPFLGDFYLTHPDIKMPGESSEVAVRAAHGRTSSGPAQAYLEECLAGASGVRGQDFAVRWIVSTVADVHRLLLRGGVVLYPADERGGPDPRETGRPRLLYEANPLGFLVEQAGGRASTGREALLGVVPTALHQQIGMALGSAREIEHIERHYADPFASRSGQPLFGDRGLFRA